MYLCRVYVCTVVDLSKIEGDKPKYGMGARGGNNDESMTPQSLRLYVGPTYMYM